MEGCALEVGVEAILVLVFFLEVEVGDGHVNGREVLFGCLVDGGVDNGRAQHADQKAEVVNWRFGAGQGG